MKKEYAIKKIYELLENDENLLNECIEQLDGWNGYLQDDRYYEMEYLSEFYCDTDPIEILNRAYFGYNEDFTDKDGNHPEPFNPNAEYFRYNGYGNLVSSNYKDYSDHLDDYFINELLENHGHLYLPEEIQKIIEEYETTQETA